MNYYNNNNNIVVIIDANRGTMMNLRTALFPPRLTPTVRVVLYTFFFFLFAPSTEQLVAQPDPVPRVHTMR